MRYVSTRDFPETRTFDQVILEGAAPDGGLYVPAPGQLAKSVVEGIGHQDFVSSALNIFGAESASKLVDDAFANFHHSDMAPIVEVGPNLVMEMFWGPTLSFKDHALQVLARLIDRSLNEKGERRTVLVATSGDTGSAAIHAFRGLESVDIVVLYPDGLVSAFQRRQMTTVVDDNVTVVAVQGDFDDCQRMVKDAFASNPALASANSINWGRIAAQVGYYLSASARLGAEFDVVVPTGNFGNAYSAHLARQIGATIGRITIATNANRMLHDLFVSGQIDASESVPTLAPAMDIQVPSNLERYLYDHEPDEFASDFGAGWASDDEIRTTIGEVFEHSGYLIDPHTATAWAVADELGPPERPRLIVSTAHPAKFPETITEATGVVPEVPEWAAIDPELPEHQVQIGPDVAELMELLG